MDQTESRINVLVDEGIIERIDEHRVRNLLSNRIINIYGRTFKELYDKIPIQRISNKDNGSRQSKITDYFDKKY